jgi:hypothetical protein
VLERSLFSASMLNFLKEFFTGMTKSPKIAPLGIGLHVRRAS